MLFFKNKKKDSTSNVEQAPVAGGNTISDLSYIREIKVNEQVMVPFSGWKVYDILFDTGNYGWNYMVDSADYLTKADVSAIDLSSYNMAGSELHLRDQLFNSNGDIKGIEELKHENWSLAIMGESRALRKSVRIVWFNQSNRLRVYTDETDITLMTRYVETIVRRTFGTETAMALAQPVKK